MINLIPMAGLGTRFSDEGYKLSKPLIPVSGEPMIIKVIRDLPKADKWIFVIRQEHKDYGVDDLIKKEIPEAIFIVVQGTTEGQACTCMLAEEHLNSDEELFIAACDNGFLYNKEKFEELKNREDVDSIVWTLTQMDMLKKKPTAFGWYKLDEDKETINDISVKVPVSEDPFNDHAVCATFWFKHAKDFAQATNNMIEQDYRINNEFYVDSIPKFLKQMNKKSIIFDVDLYVSWNKPEDLHNYEVVEFVAKHGIVPQDFPEEPKRLMSLWKKYFEK
jgi:dTDP-glucose pyrophosphorylase